MAKGLGKGLSALMSEDDVPSAPIAGAAQVSDDDRVQHMPVAQIQAGMYQPRRNFSDEDLHELADSIEKNGIIQPIIVRSISEGRFEIIAGERRFRAAKLAELTEVPVIVRVLEDTQALEIALIENIQRKDLNPLEEAQAYERLLEEFSHTQESLARAVGKSRSHIANLLRLLELPASVKKHVDAGALTMGHARAILGADKPEALAERVVKEGLNVRQTETLARGDSLEDAPAAPSGAPKGKSDKSSAPRSKASATKDSDVAEIEAMLSGNLGLEVSITQRGSQKGDVSISYENLTELDEILRRLGGSI